MGLLNNMSRNVRKPVVGVSDQVRHKLVCTVTESLKFQIEEEEELYYPNSENKGAVTAKLICAFVLAYNAAHIIYHVLSVTIFLINCYF